MSTKVNYKLSKKLDKKMGAEFIDPPEFTKDAFELPSKLKEVQEVKDEKEKRKIISDYFDKFYEDNIQKLKHARDDFKNEWRKVEKDFFEETKRLFGDEYLFPPGEYTGYISSVNFNPRFLEKKAFQVYFKHPQGPRYVTAHELLHFAFYDYTQDTFPKLFNDKDPNKEIYWDLAEIFNDVVLATEGFKSIHGQQDVPVYPKHEKYLEKFTELWKKIGGVDEFIDEGYKILKGA